MVIFSQGNILFGLLTSMFLFFFIWMSMINDSLENPVKQKPRKFNRRQNTNARQTSEHEWILMIQLLPVPLKMTRMMLEYQESWFRTDDCKVINFCPTYPSPSSPLSPITIIQFTPHLLPIPLPARHCSQKGEEPPPLQMLTRFYRRKALHHFAL